MNWFAISVLSVALLMRATTSLRAQLEWPGPEPGEPTRAITVGLAMNHGLAGLGFDQAIPRTPLVVGLGAGIDGYAAHLDLGLPKLRLPEALPSPSDNDIRAEPYASVGFLVMPPHNEYAAGGAWLFEGGVRGWPRARRGFYFDTGIGVMRRAYGDVGMLPLLLSFRLLAGVAF